MMSHTTVFQAKNVIGSLLLKFNAQAIHISWHGLCLSDESVGRIVNRKSVIDVKARNPELYQFIDR